MPCLRARPVRPPGGSQGTDRSYTPRSSASAARKLAVASGARLGVRPRRRVPTFCPPGCSATSSAYPACQYRSNTWTTGWTRRAHGSVAHSASSRASSTLGPRCCHRPPSRSAAASVFTMSISESAGARSRRVIRSIYALLYGGGPSPPRHLRPMRPTTQHTQTHWCRQRALGPDPPAHPRTPPNRRCCGNHCGKPRGGRTVSPQAAAGLRRAAR